MGSAHQRSAAKLRSKQRKDERGGK